MCFIVDKSIFLPYRVNYYITNGWAGYIIYPHALSASSSTIPINDSKQVAFTGHWYSIQTVEVVQMDYQQVTSNS